MSQFYADRAIVSINGFELFEAKSCKLTDNRNLARVDTMSRNRRSAGFTVGNRHVSAQIVLPTKVDKSQINLALKSPTADVTMRVEIGGSVFTAIGGEQGQLDLDASVGSADRTLALEFLDIVDEKGKTANADLGL